MDTKLKNSFTFNKLRQLGTSSLAKPIDQPKTDLFGLTRKQNHSSQSSKIASNSTSRATRAFSLRYRGSATTTLGRIDPATGRVINGTVRSSRTGTIGEVANPRVAGGIRETNPFSLSISSSPSEVAGLREGAFTMNSALPFNFRGGFLVQYWNLRYNGTQLSGQLTNPGNQFALAPNLINTRGTIAPDQITMNRGTTITGRITTNQIQVRIQGTGVTLLSGQYASVVDAVLTR